jgi:hypothetical protein
MSGQTARTLLVARNTTSNTAEYNWNSWNSNRELNYISASKDINSATTNSNTPIYWEFAFNRVVNVSAVEIFPRGNCCPERNYDLKLEFYLAKDPGIIESVSPLQFQIPTILYLVKN